MSRVKTEIRRIIKQRLEDITYHKATFLSDKIISKLLKVFKSPNFNSFFIYVSKNKEVQTHYLIKELLKENKIVTVPKIINNYLMIPCQINNFNQLKPGKYNTLEPEGGIYTKKIDVCIVPCVAISEEKDRIGKGAGYYDRFLARNPDIYTIALAYEKQIHPSIPQSKKDRSIDLIITESRII